jgi:hypothetical protein
MHGFLHAALTRRPGESRDPLVSLREVDGWVPAFAGTRIYAAAVPYLQERATAE